MLRAEQIKLIFCFHLSEPTPNTIRSQGLQFFQDLQVPKEREKYGPQMLSLELAIKKLAGGTVGINVLEIKQT